MSIDFSFSSRSISRSLLVEKCEFGCRQRAAVDAHFVDLSGENADVGAEVRTDPQCIGDRDRRLRKIDRLSVADAVAVEVVPEDTGDRTGLRKSRESAEENR